MPGWPNYVALGDSLTAGRDDYSTEGGRIGWARRLAAILGMRTGVPCSLTNLAEDGANVAVVAEWQLPAVARLGPQMEFGTRQRSKRMPSLPRRSIFGVSISLRGSL